MKYCVKNKMQKIHFLKIFGSFSWNYCISNAHPLEKGRPNQLAVNLDGYLPFNLAPISARVIENRTTQKH
jgi:hypothetical protein